MERSPNQRTLFHLVPQSQSAINALAHPDNQPFVSDSGQGRGLEIGFHVPSLPGGPVIARLGRDSDLILNEPDVSRVHVAFEVHPESLVVLLINRSSAVSRPVVVSPIDKVDGQDVGTTAQSGDEDGDDEDGDDEDGDDEGGDDEGGDDEGGDGAHGDGAHGDGAHGDKAHGNCVILYGQNYSIKIASCEFCLTWRREVSGRIQRASTLRKFTLKEYQDSVQRSRHLIPRLQPTDVPASDTRSYYLTRVHTTRALGIEEIPRSRRFIGCGAFGKVWKGVDRNSGTAFAVKVVELDKFSNPVHAHAAIHRETKALEVYAHPNIIEFLGAKGWDTNKIEIFMPLRDGTLDGLAKYRKAALDEPICLSALQQILSALDFLASHNQCHRDIKPANILFSEIRPGKYLFQLADFGLANHASLAKTFCGTRMFMAPELQDARNGQSPKMDVWSLLVTFLVIHPNAPFPPDSEDYGIIVRSVCSLASQVPALRPMARRDPLRRASAGQMLVAMFKGEGLHSKKAKVPPIEPDDDGDDAAVPPVPTPALPTPTPAPPVPKPALPAPTPAPPVPKPALPAPTPAPPVPVPMPASPAPMPMAQQKPRPAPTKADQGRGHRKERAAFAAAPPGLILYPPPRRGGAGLIAAPGPAKPPLFHRRNPAGVVRRRAVPDPKPKNRARLVEALAKVPEQEMNTKPRQEDAGLRMPGGYPGSQEAD